MLRKRDHPHGETEVINVNQTCDGNISESGRVMWNQLSWALPGPFPFPQTLTNLGAVDLSHSNRTLHLQMVKPQISRQMKLGVHLRIGAVLLNFLRPPIRQTSLYALCLLRKATTSQILISLARIGTLLPSQTY